MLVLGPFCLALALAAELHVPADHPTVEQAAQAAAPGDVIVIAAGTFAQDIDIDVPGLTLRGAGMDVTVLGDGTGSVALGALEGSLTIEDLTVDANNERAAIELVDDQGDLVLRRVAIRNSEGVWFRGRDLVVEDCVFEDNRSTDPYEPRSALDARGTGTVQITGTRFCNNHNDDGEGGAFSARNHTFVRIEGSTFVANEASDGGAVMVAADASELVNNTFFANEACCDASAVDARGDRVLLLSNLFMGQDRYRAVDELSGGVLDPASDHNLWFANDNGDTDADYGPNDVFEDPLLASATPDCATFDGRLLPGSPAIGAGSPDGIHDDIGAIDYVDADADGFSLPEDCDDEAADRYPGAPELCDGLDNDCDGDVDEEAELLRAYPDADGDGSGNADLGVDACPVPDGYVLDGTDCDDTDDAVGPHRPEVPCNGVDDDCDPTTPDEVDDCDAPTGTGNGTGPTGTTSSPDGDTPPDDLVATGAEGDDAAGLSTACGCASTPAASLWEALVRRR